MALRDLNLNRVHCWTLNHNRVKKTSEKLYFDGISVHFVINWGESYENSERCLRASVAEFQAFFTSDNLQKPNL